MTLSCGGRRDRKRRGRSEYKSDEGERRGPGKRDEEEKEVEEEGRKER